MFIKYVKFKNYKYFCTIKIRIFPKLAKFFRALLTSSSFDESWKIDNVTPIPKGSTPTQFPLEYRPISITPIISKIYKKLTVRRLYKFVNVEKTLPQIQFDFKKGILGTSDALVLLKHNFQPSLDKCAESRVVSLDFSSAFDLVSHQALLFKLRLMGIGDLLFNVFKNI